MKLSTCLLLLISISAASGRYIRAPNARKLTEDSKDSDDSDDRDEKDSSDSDKDDSDENRNSGDSDNEAVVKWDGNCFHVDCDEDYDQDLYHALKESGRYCKDKSCGGSGDN